jgi:hypothetical protein
MKRSGLSGYPEGIMGLAFNNLNALGTSTVLSTLGQQHSPNERLFALCFEEVGGIMEIGSRPENVGTWVDVPLSPLHLQTGFWQLPFLDVSANGVSLGVPKIFNTPGIVDSGTPFFTLPTR